MQVRQSKSNSLKKWGGVALVALPVALLGAIVQIRKGLPEPLPIEVSGQRMVLTPDGRYLVQNSGAVGQIAVASLRDLTQANQQPRETYSGDIGASSLVALRDSKHVAGTQAAFTSAMRTSIALYDLKTSAAFRVIARGQVAGAALAASPREDIVAASDPEGALCLWNTSTGKRIQRWPLFGTAQGSAGSRSLSVPSALAFSPDGALLAVGGKNNYSSSGSTSSWSISAGDVVLWDVKRGVKVRGFALPSSEQLRSDAPFGWASVNLTSLVFSPDGKWLATDSNGDGVVVWNVSDGSLHKVLPHPAGSFSGHMFGGGGVMFSPDSRLVAAPSNRGALDVWSVADGTLSRQLKGKGPFVFTTEGSLISVGDKGRHLVMWKRPG